MVGHGGGQEWSATEPGALAATGNAIGGSVTDPTKLADSCRTRVSDLPKEWL